MNKKSLLTTGFALFLIATIGSTITSDVYAANSLTVSGDAVINLTPSDPNGTFAKSNDINITASTDNPAGYKLIIQATDSTSLVSGENSIASLDSGTSMSESTFSNGSYNGRWGFKPSMFNSSNNSNYLPSPSTIGDIINETSCANGTADCPNTSDSYTIVIGAKIDLSQPVGSYSNTFNIIMLGNGVEYSVKYKDTTVDNMPEDVSGETEESTVIISSDIPTREGYNFLGWCTVQPALDGSCSGVTYSPGDTYSLSGLNDNLSLYARWGTTSTGNTIATATYMQDVTSCPSSITVGTQYTLTDKRDGKTYTVARQADGKCWMTQNLDLEIGGSNTQPLTSENTNINTSGSGAYERGYRTVAGNTIWEALDTATTSTKVITNNPPSEGANSLAVTNWEGSLTLPYSAEGADVYVYTSGSENEDTTFTSLNACKAAHSESDCKHYHVGNYYNWPASIASNNPESLNETYQGASNDICPKGWRLPIGRSSETVSASTMEFGQLLYSAGVTDAIDSTTFTTNGHNLIRTNPLYIVRGGNINSSAFSARGTTGLYQTSSSNNDSSYGFTLNNSYTLDFTMTSGEYGSKNINPNQATLRTYGLSIRCIVR